MSNRLRWRKFVSHFMLTMTGLCALVAVAVLFFILGYLVYHGGTSVSWNFFTKLPAPVGEVGGGMANAIVGSAKLLLLACLLGGIQRRYDRVCGALRGGFVEWRALDRHRNFCI
jgi:ABC-type phosphate transport system permease subunit